MGALLRILTAGGLRWLASKIDVADPVVDETSDLPTPEQRPLTPDALAMMAPRAEERPTMRPEPLEGSLAARVKDRR